MDIMQSAKILVVDDHADSLAALAKLLRVHGYEVRSAESYHSALTVAKAERIDLLVCDIGLADGDGCDLLRELQGMYCLEAIAVTGYGSEDDVKRCREAGFRAHVLKPVHFQRLTQSIADALSQQRQLAR